MSKRLAPTWIEIDLKALQHNFEALKTRLPRGCKALAVVKSNAYGHGAVEVVQSLKDADAFGVGTIDEGIELREAGVKQPILILLGIIEPYLEELIHYQLTPVLYDLETARALNYFLLKKGQTHEVHLKVDTGMTRLGVLSGQAAGFFTEVARLTNLRPVGLLSHLADAGNREVVRCQEQEMQEAWQEFTKIFPGAGLHHLANSLATIDKRVADSAAFARLGIALYGAYPLPRQKSKVKLQPVMHWKSQLVSVKQVPKGSKVSYGGTYTTRRASSIGVIPVGYADGYFRNLSNRADVLIRGKRIPIVGNICMDMMMVDVTHLPGIKVGEEVVLMGRQGNQEIRAEELADQAGTISYEIFCRVSPRLNREYLR